MSLQEHIYLKKLSEYRNGKISSDQLNEWILSVIDVLPKEFKSDPVTIDFTLQDWRTLPERVKIGRINTKCCGMQMEKTKESYYTCLKCGIVGDMELSDFNNQSFERMKDTNLKSKVIYKRINYFNDWLNKLQGNGDLPDDVLNKTIDKFRINKLEVNPQNTKRVLKELKLPKFYNSVNHICNNLQGIPVIILPTDVVSKLNTMFAQIQNSYEKHKGNRRNFISYPYVLFKFFEILQLSQYYELCRMLDSREKLLEHDLIWKSICKDMDWEYFVTV